MEGENSKLCGWYLPKNGSRCHRGARVSHLDQDNRMGRQMTQRVDFFIPGEGESKTPFHYAACGLDYVYLLNGVVREDDPDYGEIIAIKDQEELHKSIGLHIIEKPTMTNKEFKFLRKVMG